MNDSLKHRETYKSKYAHQTPYFREKSIGFFLKEVLSEVSATSLSSESQGQFPHIAVLSSSSIYRWNSTSTYILIGSIGSFLILSVGVSRHELEQTSFLLTLFPSPSLILKEIGFRRNCRYSASLRIRPLLGSAVNFCTFFMSRTNARLYLHSA